VHRAAACRRQHHRGGIDVSTPSFVDSLSTWLVSHQPITLAVNGPEGDLSLALKLFEQTAQVVYTVGSVEAPALTCQARPQDGEVFGEFPVRRQLAQHTKYPVIVPTPTPAYNSTYTTAFLESHGAGWNGDGLPPAAAAVAAAVTSDATRGYLRVLGDYLTDACACNPKVGANPGGRTALYGLQTTPRNGQLNYIRCAPGATLDALAPHMLPFVMTNAHSQLRLSVAPANAALASANDAARREM